MTITSTTNRNDYTGVSSVGPHSFSFKIFDEDDLEVSITEDDVTTTLVYPTDYTVTGVGETAGGTITLVDTPTDATLTIRRVLDITQPYSFRNQGTGFGSTVEEALDRMTAMMQQVWAGVESSLRIPATSDPDGFETELPTPVAGQALGWDGTGTALTNLPTTGLVNNTIITSSSPTSTSFSVENTSAGGKLWTEQVVGSGTPTRVGNFELVNTTEGLIALKVTPNGKLIMSGGNTSEGVLIEVPGTNVQLGGTGVIGKVVQGRISADGPGGGTLNDPAVNLIMHTRGYDMNLNSVNMGAMESLAAFFDQVRVSGGLHAGTTGDRQFCAEWSDYELEAAAGANLDAFKGRTMVVDSKSAAFTGGIYGEELDTNLDAPSAVSVTEMVGYSSYTGPNSGAGTVSQGVDAFYGVPVNNGTVTAARLTSFKSKVQITSPGIATNVAQFDADDITAGPSGSLGTVSGTVYKYLARRGVIPNASMGALYAFYAEETTGVYLSASQFNSRFGGGDWNNGHIQLGSYHIWVDNTGDLRIKSSAPTSTTDGTVIGTQS